IAVNRLRETFSRRKLAKRLRRGLGGAMSGREKGSRSGGSIRIHASARGMEAPSKRSIIKKAASRGVVWPNEGRRSNTAMLSSELFRGVIVAGDGTALHDEFYLFKNGDVVERIAVHGDDVGIVSGFDGASFAGEAEEVGCVDGGSLNGVNGLHAPFDHFCKLLVVVSVRIDA